VLKNRQARLSTEGDQLRKYLKEGVNLSSLPTLSKKENTNSKWRLEELCGTFVQAQRGKTRSQISMTMEAKKSCTGKSEGEAEKMNA